jgi:hypothetical protein
MRKRHDAHKIVLIEREPSNKIQMIITFYSVGESRKQGIRSLRLDG